MAFPTAVNSQITDAVTQTNVQVLSESPAMAMGSLYQSMASAMGLAMQNSVSQQQHSNTLAQAITTQCIETLIGK
ncbi:RebB family R body protein [Polaribacter sp. SA4-12]|uniref:RebB family R body protein n=1 Tax=Polaribacter sp. SA4-12 TaxID=1312072 RepID=UPI000B3D36B3|nr:RebB family R body protein [Polaribacter sp. SA4-12]